MNPRHGFTLLEALVATLIMGVAVAGLLSNLSVSLNNASRIAAHERATLLAKRTLDGLLAEPRLPRRVPMEGSFEEAVHGIRGGWRAVATVFEAPPQPAPGTRILERVQLELWWMEGSNRRTLTLEACHASVLDKLDLEAPAP